MVAIKPRGNGMVAFTLYYGSLLRPDWKTSTKLRTLSGR